MKTEVVFLEATTLCSIVLETPYTLLFNFWFSPFEMGGNRELFHSCFKGDGERGVCFIFVSTKQLITFSQHIAQNSFLIAYDSTK